MMSPAKASSVLRQSFTETLSTFREVVAWPLDVPPSVPRDLRHEEDVVVMVHGFFATAGVWRPMKRAVAYGTGASVASFSHAPGVGVDRIARSLARLVDRVPSSCRVHLVGHSLGGLVARYYVQELGGHTRVSQTISLGSPFAGTNRAHPFPFLVGRDLSHRSPLLARLRARAHEHDVPHTSFVGDSDIVVAPVESAIFPRGDVVVLPHCGHNTLLFHGESIAQVIDRVRAVQEAAKRERAAHP